MSVFRKMRRRIALLIAPKGSGAGYRTYSAGKSSRLTSGWGTVQTSADSEILSSLRTMRGRSREDQRDKPYAKRAKAIVQNNVVGFGIGLQARVKTTRDSLNSRVNTGIETAWEDWCRAENCHTGGTLHFSDLERLAIGQVFEAGEVFIRKHRTRFGESSVPFALEVIEPERVIDDQVPAALNATGKVRMGVEMDDFQRPVAYHIRRLHPGDVSFAQGTTDYIERVPASDIVHLRIVDRWPQTRGVPWMHAAMRKLEDTDGYSYSEIVRARAESNIVGALKTSRPYGEAVKDANGNITEREVTEEPGTYKTLYEEEELQFPPRTSPNSAADPFLRYMLREIAAGTGVSYEALSGDYSQSNYSSSRLAQLGERDLWRVLQMWFIRSFREPIHREWMNAAVLARALDGLSVDAFYADPARYLAVRWKPRGWSWVDPTKEVEAYKAAEKAGYITKTQIIAQTANGMDHEDVMDERASELEAQEEKGLVFDTDPVVIEAEIAAKKQPAAPPESGKSGAAAAAEDEGGQENGNGGGKKNGEGRKSLPGVSGRAERHR